MFSKSWFRGLSRWHVISFVVFIFLVGVLFFNVEFLNAVIFLVVSGLCGVFGSLLFMIICLVDNNNWVGWSSIKLRSNDAFVIAFNSFLGGWLFRMFGVGINGYLFLIAFCGSVVIGFLLWHLFQNIFDNESPDSMEIRPY